MGISLIYADLTAQNAENIPTAHLKTTFKVAADPTVQEGFKFLWKRSFIQSLLTSAATFLTGGYVSMLVLRTRPARGDARPTRPTRQAGTLLYL